METRDWAGRAEFVSPWDEKAPTSVGEGHNKGLARQGQRSSMYVGGSAGDQAVQLVRRSIVAR